MKILKILTLAVMLAAFFMPAKAQTVCAERAKLTLVMEQSWGMTLIHRGIVKGSETQVVEVWKSPEGRWAIVVSTGKVACIMAAGSDWE